MTMFRTLVVRLVGLDQDDDRMALASPAIVSAFADLKLTIWMSTFQCRTKRFTADSTFPLNKPFPSPESESIAIMFEPGFELLSPVILAR